jgi:hypothetical protein
MSSYRSVRLLNAAINPGIHPDCMGDPPNVEKG